jgi:hypothetical protein
MGSSDYMQVLFAIALARTGNFDQALAIADAQAERMDL